MASDYEVALTTVDNPYNPIDDYDNWRAYDTQQGYYCDEYVARILRTSEDLSEKQQKDDYEAAIDEIVSLNPLGVYRKFTQKA